MRQLSGKKLIDSALSHYLDSREFKGLPLSGFFGNRIEDVEWVKRFLKPLIETQRLTVRCDAVDLNPFIKRMSDLSPEQEVDRLSEWQGGVLVAYPTRQELEQKVRREDYSGRPFTLEMALGAAWLDFRSFDLAVLEQYRNDPRYYYRVTDTHGFISVHDEPYLGDEMKSGDKVLIPHFGFAYDDSMNRAVAVFMSDLNGLSPEHQRIWEARILNRGFKLHPIFWKTQIKGDWVKDMVVTDAILWEMHRINELSRILNRPDFFKKDFWQAERPRNFCFLIRPTAKEFSEFCQTLDKMLSENINRSFFQGEVPETEEKALKSGKVQVIPKGTIRLLKEWLFKNWHPKDRAAFDAKLSVLKMVRDLRNPQAHSLTTDSFDQKFLKEQRELLSEVFDVLEMLRIILESHPAIVGQTRGQDRPDGKIYLC